MKLLLCLVMLAGATAVAQTDSAQSTAKKNEAKAGGATANATSAAGATASAAKSGAADETIPTLDGGIGPCTAEFHVLGADNKPVYNAQVHTLIKYGAFGVKKLDLQGSTNVDGKMKFTGLPDVNKRPVFFDIKQGTKTAQRSFEPGANCNPVFEVILR
jgi:hypothetical protein